jgi:hypothetical protein
MVIVMTNQAGRVKEGLQEGKERLCYVHVCACYMVCLLDSTLLEEGQLAQQDLGQKAEVIHILPLPGASHHLQAVSPMTLDAGNILNSRLPFHKHILIVFRLQA